MSVYDDPNYDPVKHDPKLEDDLAGMLFDGDNYARDSGQGSAEDRERERRVERQLLEGLASGLGENLRGQGFSVVSAGPERGAEPGYVFVVRDSEGRQFEARMSFDEALGMGEAFARRAVGLLTEKVLAARARYFERMR